MIVKSEVEIREEIKLCEEQYRKTCPLRDTFALWALLQGKIIALKWVLGEKYKMDV